MISAFGVDHGSEVSKVFGIKGTLKTGQYLRNPMAAASADIGAGASVTGQRLAKPGKKAGRLRTTTSRALMGAPAHGITHTGHRLEGVLNAKKAVSSAGLDKPSKAYALQQVTGMFA